MNQTYLNFYSCFKELKFRFFLISFLIFNFLILGFLKKESLIGLVLTLSKQNSFMFTKVTGLFLICVYLLENLTKKILYIYLFSHFSSFVFSGLRSSEKLALKKVFYLSIYMLITSFFISSFVIFPCIWNFFTKTLSVNLIFEKFLFFEASLENYIFFFNKTFDLTFLSFFSVLIGFLFLKKKNKNTEKYRKEVFLLFLFFSTILTPPDIFSQIFFCVFLNLLYEIALLSCIYVSNLKR